MLEKIKDSLFYEGQLRAWLRLFDLPIMLEGNRIAEAYRQSPSTGKAYNVELLRSLFHEKFPQALYWGKKNGQPSRDVAFRFVCDLLDAYVELHRGEAARDPFAFIIERAAQVTGHQLPHRWQHVVDQQRAEYRHARKLQDERMPSLVEAREIGKSQFLELAAKLEASPIPDDAIAVWQALSTEFTTECGISHGSGIPLAIVCAWLPMFASRDLIAVRGTSLPEPHYRRSSIVPSHPANAQIWAQLNASGQA
jgi:hypothetical protein